MPERASIIELINREGRDGKLRFVLQSKTTAQANTENPEWEKLAYAKLQDAPQHGRDDKLDGIHLRLYVGRNYYENYVVGTEKDIDKVLTILRGEQVPVILEYRERTNDRSKRVTHDVLISVTK